MNDSFLEQITKQILVRTENKLGRTLEEVNRLNNTEVIIGTKKYVSFSCNNYLGLAFHEKVTQSVINTVQKYGFGASASRLIDGNHSFYAELEEKLSQHYKKESSVIFSSGYTANLGTLGTIITKRDLVIADRVVHACLLDGIKASNAKLLRFKHNDHNHCKELMQKYRNDYNNCFIVVESVYSMLGDTAPLEQLLEICSSNNAMLYVDDAHGFGITNLPKEITIISGSLSKALGSIGGFISCSSKIAQYLINYSKNFIYTTALPPSAITASSVAYDLHHLEIAKLKHNISFFCHLMNIPTASSHIIPINTVSSDSALNISQKLKQCGFLAKAIRPPTVPKPILRVVLTSAHSEIQIQSFCVALKNSELTKKQTL